MISHCESNTFADSRHLGMSQDASSQSEPRMTKATFRALEKKARRLRHAARFEFPSPKPPPPPTTLPFVSQQRPTIQLSSSVPISICCNLTTAARSSHPLLCNPLPNVRKTAPSVWPAELSMLKSMWNGGPATSKDRRFGTKPNRDASSARVSPSSRMNWQSTLVLAAWSGHILCHD